MIPPQINKDVEKTTYKRILKIIVEQTKATHNDAELGAKIRVIVDEIKDFQQKMEEFDKQLAKEIYKEQLNTFVLKSKISKSKSKPSGPHPSEVIDKW